MPPPFTTGDDIASLSFLPGQPVTFDYDALAGFDRAMLDFSALTSNFTVSLSADFYRLLSADGQIDITLRRFERIEILGSQGNDTLFDAGHTVQFVIDAGAGNDSLSGWTQADTLLGGAGDDHLFSQAGNDSLDGGDGNDTVNGHAGNDTVLGGAGHDTVNGGFDNDLLYGGEGDDLIFGEAQGNFAEPYTNDWNTFGTDTIYGGAGNDILLSYAAADTLIGGAGNDTIYGGATAADLRDAIYGGDGDDYIDGGYGNDDLSGGNGNDTVLGDFGADTVIGNAGNDLLTGAAGSDLMFGNDGADTLNGGFGHDRMNGGAGADRFFTSASSIMAATGCRITVPLTAMCWSLASPGPVPRSFRSTWPSRRARAVPGWPRPLSSGGPPARSSGRWSMAATRRRSASIWGG